MRDARRFPAQALHRGREATHELIIIVGIQNIVLAVILALRDEIDGSESLGEIVPRDFALDTAAIGITTPVKIDAGEIAAIIPSAFVDQGAEACAIGSWLRAEHPIGRLPLRRLAAHAAGFKRPSLGPDIRGNR